MAKEKLTHDILHKGCSLILLLIQQIIQYLKPFYSYFVLIKWTKTTKIQAISCDYYCVLKYAKICDIIEWIKYCFFWEIFGFTSPK